MTNVFIVYHPSWIIFKINENKFNVFIIGRR